MVTNKLIAIRGSVEDGKNIIKYLESIGGSNSYTCSGANDERYYHIDNEGNIQWEDNFKILKKEGYTLLEKIPGEKIYELW